MLAAELRLCGADPVVLERLPKISEIPKGNGLVGQIVPMLDYRGLLDRFRAEATYAGAVPQFGFGPLRLKFSRLGNSPLHILAIPQRRLEQLLGERLGELGGTIRRGHELTGFTQDPGGVTLDVSGPGGGYRMRAGYLVGCDGAHSLVRKQAGIGFPGVTYPEISRMGRVVLPTAQLARRGDTVKIPGIGRLPVMRQVRTQTGTYSLGPLASLDRNARAGTYIVYIRQDDPSGDLASPMSLGELRESARQVLGADLPMTDPQWLTKLAGNSRLADRYQSGRVLLAGDAAHVLGAGGSLNTGLLDAVNLGWKLAAQVAGGAPEGLLASYHTERHLAGRHALLHTRAQRALSALSGGQPAQPGQPEREDTQALHELFGDADSHPDPLRHINDLLKQPELLRRIGELIEGSDVCYPMPANGEQPRPLAGRLAPDLRLQTAAGNQTRIAELLRPARGILLDFTPEAGVAAAASNWANRVTITAGRCLAHPAPAAALLIRPDGYVAWSAPTGSAGPDQGLPTALQAWFG
jgi:2-polyprenyl-6-methoxyphenol hydroxylase-like FAD-dependent oxidoreductase